MMFTARGRFELARSSYNPIALWLNTIYVKVKSNRIGLVYEDAVITKAVRNLDNMYQYCVLTYV